uniref:Voltage-gated hydrogen channel 1 n=1 Tax=Biomphalaria glabrata TaxID=6526 RepID=A0A2C9L5V3_BIOGL
MGDAGPKTNPRNRGLSSPWMPRLRKRGEKILHSKYVVILVIILTITDCALVIAELILDLYSVKKTLSATENQTFSFILAVKKRYPDDFKDSDTVAYIYEKVANATILWDNPVHDQIRLRVTPETAAKSTPSINMSAAMGQPWENFSATPVDLRTNRAGSVSRTIQVDTSRNISHTGRRFRRSFKSNSTEAPISASNNEDSLDEDLTRVTSLTILVQSFRHILDYLISGVHEHLLQNSSPSNNDDDPYISEEEDDILNEAFGEGYLRYAKDLLVLYAQLSEMFTMQLNNRLTYGAAPETTKQSGNSTPLHNPPLLHNSEPSSSLTLDARDFNDKSSTGATNSKLSDIHAVVEDGDYDTPGIKGAIRRVIRDVDSSNYSVIVEPDKGHNDTTTGQQVNQDLEKDMMRRQLHHSKEMEIAHKLHYASLFVVSILLIGVTSKIICKNTHNLERQIAGASKEVFDAIVIIASFAVDLTFIKGLAEFAVDDSIFVLVFLLPWRVIRVVNSLVMAVIDHEHVKLRLLYSRKKKLDKTVETLRNETDELKGMLQDVRQFCIKEGIDASLIDSMLGKFAPRRRKDSKFYTLVKLVMSTASMNNNDNDSISSSSMENDLRHIANRDSALAEVPSSQGTMSSLKHYLSVPFCSPPSNSNSDVESMAGDVAIRSPSIFVTSPTSDDGCGNGTFSFCDVEMEVGNDEAAAAGGSCRLDTPDSIIEEEVAVATMSVTSNTLHASPPCSVAFFVGSQSSLDIKSSADDSNGSSNLSSEGKDNGGWHYGQFLTVPECLVDMTDCDVATNNNHNNNHVTEDHVLDSPADTEGNKTKFEMRRSASENVNVNTVEPFSSHVRHGSPVPLRRVPDVRSKRKEYSRSRSESEDKEAVLLLRPDSKARFRRHSGEPRTTTRSELKSELENSRRSTSPTPASYLTIPGQSVIGGSVTYSSSRSMNDVSYAGNVQANNIGNDGRILRRSCLSLNSDGRKRRAKSAHRVSFKVS